MLYMNKFIFLFNLVYVLLIFRILILSIIPICVSPSLPIYYLLYILVYLLLIVFYLIFVTNSILCYYIFLIVAGGIIVTFLFFIVLVDIEIYIIVFLWFFIFLIIILLGLITIISIDFNYLIWDKLDIKLGAGTGECYISPLALYLTFTCMLLLLYVIFVSVKISTYLKSSPIRKLVFKL